MNDIKVIHDKINTSSNGGSIKTFDISINTDLEYFEQRYELLKSLENGDFPIIYKVKTDDITSMEMIYEYQRRYDKNGVEWIKINHDIEYNLGNYEFLIELCKKLNTSSTPEISVNANEPLVRANEKYLTYNGSPIFVKWNKQDNASSIYNSNIMDASIYEKYTDIRQIFPDLQDSDIIDMDIDPKKMRGLGLSVVVKA